MHYFVCMEVLNFISNSVLTGLSALLHVRASSSILLPNGKYQQTLSVTIFYFSRAFINLMNSMRQKCTVEHC